MCNHMKRKFTIKDVGSSFTINDSYILKEFDKTINKLYNTKIFLKTNIPIKLFDNINKSMDYVIIFHRCTCQQIF